MITFFNTNYLEYLLLQRTRLKTEYLLNQHSNNEEVLAAINKMTDRDFQMLESFLPKENINNILDIGCGLGTIDVYFHHKFPTAKLFLQDKTDTIESNRKYNGFNKTYYYYNNLTLLEEFLRSNNVKNFNIVDGETLFEKNVKFDLILSLLSCGWHYSILQYLDYIKTHIDEKGTLIIDVRNNTEEDLLYKTFHNVNRIFNKNEKRYDGGIVGYRYICSHLI
jgi:SAM-dependent methyltransferase